MVEFKKILDFIIYILKIFIYFDTSNIKYQSGGGENNSEESEEEKNNTDKATNEIEQSGTLPYWFRYIKETIMGVLTFVGAKVTTFISMLLFASVAPIIPFFVSMAGMFGVIKYFMSKLRRL